MKKALFLLLIMTSCAKESVKPVVTKYENIRGRWIFETTGDGITISGDFQIGVAPGGDPRLTVLHNSHFTIDGMPYVDSAYELVDGLDSVHHKASDIWLIDRNNNYTQVRLDSVSWNQTFTEMYAKRWMYQKTDGHAGVIIQDVVVTRN